VKRITQIFKDLMTPDDQAQSWYGWVTNQMSHAFLGAIIATFTGAYWFIVTIAFAVTKEGFDLYRALSGPALLDSLNDILFWVMGAGAVAGGQFKFWFVFGLFVLLCFGAYYRVKRK